VGPDVGWVRQRLEEVQTRRLVLVVVIDGIYRKRRSLMERELTVQRPAATGGGGPGADGGLDDIREATAGILDAADRILDSIRPLNAEDYLQQNRRAADSDRARSQALPGNALSSRPACFRHVGEELHFTRLSPRGRARTGVPGRAWDEEASDDDQTLPDGDRDRILRLRPPPSGLPVQAEEVYALLNDAIRQERL
jgi:hypothetical protein